MQLALVLTLSLSLLPLSALAQQRLDAPALSIPASAGVEALPPLPAPRFVAPSDIDLARDLPPFPAIGSLAESADIETMLALQIRRTKVDEDDAAADSTTNMVDFTQSLLGSSYSPVTHPKLFGMMRALHDDMRGINRVANAAHGFRQRPAVRDTRIRPSLNMSGRSTTSYPSARASSAGVWAALAIEVSCQCRNGFEAITNKASVSLPSDANMTRAARIWSGRPNCCPSISR